MPDSQRGTRAGEPAGQQEILEQEEGGHEVWWDLWGTSGMLIRADSVRDLLASDSIFS